MTRQADPGYAQLVRSIFKAIQLLPAGPASPNRAEPLEPPSFVARPFLVGGERRVAKVVDTHAWDAPQRRPRPNVAGLSRDQRDILAAAWLADALDEHAAVAAFARFTLQLLSLGAPPELLRAAHRASLDEVTHAELCFGLASAYAGRDLGAGPLDTSGALQEATRLSAVLDTIREGCVGETINAMVLVSAANRCEDPAVTNVLQRIAADEMRHAGLAWRFVRWALLDHDELRDAVRRGFDDAMTQLPAPESGRSGNNWMARHGRLSPHERAEITAHCTLSVIQPCARALLEESPRSFPDAARLMTT